MTDTVPICCVYGDERPYPTEDVYIKVQGQSYLLNEEVADHLPCPVVLGQDLPVPLDLLHPIKVCNVAFTRAKAKETKPAIQPLSELPFHSAEIEAKPGKNRKTRSKKRHGKFQNTKINPSIEPHPSQPLVFQIPTDIQAIQKK